MSLNQDNSRDHSSVRFNKNVQLTGLDSFIKNLEKHFFSKATVRDISTSSTEANLVIELDCNFGLLETLHHFEKDTWGSFKCQRNSFEAAVQNLKKHNDIQIEVEEFSLFLDDTTIIVNRIYDKSISQQLENIFTKIFEHSTYLSKGLSEIPFEIYIPVFEEDIMEPEHTLLTNINSCNNKEQDYFSFWGLYYYSEDDAVVYDLRNKSIIKGNLQMLNR